MEPNPVNSMLVMRAHWLIRLRWVAAVSVAVGAYFGGNFLGISLHSSALYGIAALLALYNMTVFLLLNHFARTNGEVPFWAVKKIVNIQISADLLILTFLLHFSGGIENPFVFFFIFHMIIASILLSVRESYTHATFAVLLFGLMILLEYLHVIRHHCLGGLVSHCSYRDTHYVLGTFFVFAVTLYLVVYMASYIAVRLKRAEQAAREANSLLREKDRMKDEYVFRVTHDIKGHLAAIQSCLNLVANQTVGRVDSAAADFINRAHNRTKRLSYFVRTLLELTQMRLSGRLEMEVFSLRDAVRNTIGTVESIAREKSITLNCRLDPSVGDIYGNQFSIEEAVTNLLLNAAKYTPEKGNVTLSVKDRDDSVLIEVADTGIGIPGDEIGHIFDEFFRASNAIKVERDGTGLGLSIVKHIIGRHDGQIQVESELNHGTKFTLTLPKRR
jgi:signal transduction histidine kinase